MLHLNLLNLTRAKIFPAPFKKILKYGEEIISQLKEKNGEINLIITNNKTIHELNRKYRKIDHETDVLSFSYFQPTKSTSKKECKNNLPQLIGEIFIALPVARKQALEFKHSLTAELNKLFAHGLLHIFDFDHVTKKDFKQMEKSEKEILLT